MSIFSIRTRLPVSRSSAPSATQMRIADNSATYVVTLKRTSATRRFTLRVRNATRDVVLTIPQRASLTDARDFAEKHAAWIGERLQKLPQPLPFADGCIVPLRGFPHLVEYRAHARGTVWIESAAPQDALDSTSPRLKLCVAGRPEHVSRRIQDYLRAQALADLNVAAGAHAGKLGLTPKRIAIRDSKTRWGSCSADGSLNFSWRIILAPAFVLDYLAAHEVAHMVHLNHSAKFWTLTKRLCPETDRAEAWLNTHGTQLHRYGQPAA